MTLYENTIIRPSSLDKTDGIQAAYEKMKIQEAFNVYEAYQETTPGDDFIGPKQKRVFPKKHTEVGAPKVVYKKGDEIIKKMKKHNLIKHHTNKIDKSKKYSWKELEQLLPDFISGKDIANLFEEIELNEGGWLDVARKVVEDRSYVYINPKSLQVSDDKKKGFIVLEMTTANMLVTITDALNKESSEKFTSMSLLQAVDLGWKLIKR